MGQRERKETHQLINGVIVRVRACVAGEEYDACVPDRKAGEERERSKGGAGIEKAAQSSREREREYERRKRDGKWFETKNMVVVSARAQ